MTLRVLDAFSGVGGMAEGYSRAGFHIVGVDIVLQPRYPFRHEVADALEVLSDIDYVQTFDLVHASPPCQRYSAPTRGTNAKRGPEHPDLMAPTRELLQRAGVPYVIENVAGAPMRKDVRLCGEMFGLGVLMHRFFELGGWQAHQPAHVRHRGRVRGWRHGVYHDGPYVAAYGSGGGKASVPEMQQAKGIDWTADAWELREAIPPAYGQWIGAAFVASRRELAAAA